MPFLVSLGIGIVAGIAAPAALRRTFGTAVFNSAVILGVVAGTSTAFILSRGR